MGLQMSGALIGLVEMEGSARGVGKPRFQTNGVHKLQDPEETNKLCKTNISVFAASLKCIYQDNLRNVLPNFNLRTKYIQIINSKPRPNKNFIR